MSEKEVLERVATAVSKLPLGSSPALPWCRESFPELDTAMKEWEAITQKRIMTNQHIVKELALDLQQVYYKAFQEHLMTEPLCLRTLEVYLKKVESKLYFLEESKVAKTIFYKVNLTALLGFLQEHQNLIEYERRTFTLSIKSVVEGDSVIRVMLCSSTPQLYDLTLVMLKAAPEFMPPRKRFSQVTLEKLASAGYKPITPSLWSKSFYSKSEVGEFEDYRIKFEWIEGSFFQARVSFADASRADSICWVNQYADSIEELEENVRFLYHNSAGPDINYWKDQLRDSN